MLGCQKFGESVSSGCQAFPPRTFEKESPHPILRVCNSLARFGADAFPPRRHGLVGERVLDGLAWSAVLVASGSEDSSLGPGLWGPQWEGGCRRVAHGNEGFPTARAHPPRCLNQGVYLSRVKIAEVFLDREPP